MPDQGASPNQVIAPSAASEREVDSPGIITPSLRHLVEKLSDPSALLTIASAIGFIVGVRKIGAYYSYFGLDHWQLGIPTSTYLIDALYTVATIAGLFVYAVCIVYESRPPLARSLVFMTWMPFVVLLWGNVIGEDFTWSNAVIPIVWTVLAIISCVKRIHLFEALWPREGGLIMYNRWFNLSIIVGSFLTFAVTQGKADARKLLRSEHSASVRMSDNRILAQGEKVYLIFASGDTYYFCAVNDAQKRRTLVVPKSSVVLLTWQAEN